jgi:hypothetical protein
VWPILNQDYHVASILNQDYRVASILNQDYRVASTEPILMYVAYTGPELSSGLSELGPHVACTEPGLPCGQY